MNLDRLKELEQRPIDWRDKGFPDVEAVTVGNIGDRGWNVLAGDLPLPVMVVKDRAVERNLEIMALWCKERGLSIAPHGKTAMAPGLVARQIAHGAWGVTAATTTQARIFHHLGAARIIIANQVVDSAGIDWLRQALDDGLEIYTLVDSVEGVALLDNGLSGTSRQLGVLVELGVDGKRTGSRNLEEARHVATAAGEAANLFVAGVEAYESVVGADDTQATLAGIDELMQRMSALLVQLASDGMFEGRDEVLLTAGGSAYFDRVAPGLTGLEIGLPVRVVLRSGCYVVHDNGKYHQLSPLDGRSSGGPVLQPALEIWSAVLSCPEPGLAVLGMGKRDVSYDLQLPMPHTVQGKRGRRSVENEIEIVKLYDQHAVVRVSPELQLAVGDLVGSGIDHPCTAFDKWRLLPTVDDDYTVTGAIATFF